jgi:hypothetical protein
MDLPAGRVVVFNRTLADELKFLRDHTRPGDYFFGDPQFNYLLELRNPSPVACVTPSDYTRPEQVQQIIQSLEKYPVKYVYWSSVFDMPPPVAHTRNNLTPLRDYLLAGYHIARDFEGDDCDRSFWVKGSAPIELPPLTPSPGESGEPPNAGNPQGPQSAPLDTPARLP